MASQRDRLTLRLKPLQADAYELLESRGVDVQGLLRNFLVQEAARWGALARKPAQLTTQEAQPVDDFSDFEDT